MAASKASTDCSYQTLPIAEGGDRYIRVLTLEPASDIDKLLRGRLESTPLDTSYKQYEALSYTWGSNIRTHTIYIDGASTSTIQNLHSALLRLRTEQPRKLWIDAICINQADAEERTQQVALMRHIFPFAKRTIIWLGEPQSDDDPAFVFSFIERVRLLHPVLLQGKFDHETRWLDGRQAIYELQASEGVLVHDNDTLRGDYRHIGPEDAQIMLKRFFGLPWFSRRWVLQEVLLSNIGTLTWGAHTLPWSEFMFAVKWCDWRQLAPHAAKFNTATITNARRPDVQRTRSNILQLMIDFKDFECQDSRDKIAALQGL